MFTFGQVEPEVPTNFPDSVENLMLYLRSVRNELFSDCLVWDLRTADMNENGERGFTWDDLVISPINLSIDNLPRYIARLVEKERNLVCKSEQENLALHLDL